MTSRKDQIEKQVVLHAPIERVWNAISDAAQFGLWFGARFDGPFEPGTRVGATITGTSVDAETAARQAKYVGTRFDVWVERVDPPRHLSFRWYPGGEPTGMMDVAGPRTLVTFDLEEVEGGTLLTIREAGFEALSLEARARALSENEEGWSVQATLLQTYLARAA